MLICEFFFYKQRFLLRFVSLSCCCCFSAEGARPACSNQAPETSLGLRTFGLKEWCSWTVKKMKSGMWSKDSMGSLGVRTGLFG